MPEVVFKGTPDEYTKHIHEANWMILRDAIVYDKPYATSKVIKNVSRNTVKLYLSRWKTTKNEVAWYYFSELNGWLPWKYEGFQVIKKIGAVLNCEEENKLSAEEEKIRSLAIEEAKKQKPVPKITEFLDTNSDDHKNFLRSHMLIKEDSKLWNIKFNRMQFVDPYHIIGTTRQYLFFTKPDLHIFTPGTNTLNSELGNEPFWMEMGLRYRRIIAQLQSSSEASPALPFMPILTNSVASALDLPSSNGETTDTSQTVYGTSIQYRNGSLKSDENFDFSLEFYDNDTLDLYHLFKMYDSYENLKMLGIVSPPKYKDSLLNRYIVDKILHDQIGVYKIIVGDDMETIIHYSYLCGCFPKSVPRDTFREIEPGLLRYSIDWHAQFVEDMNPEILIDFNELCKKYISVTKDVESNLWDSDRHMINGNWTSCPYITMSTDKTRANGVRYKLKWFDKKK